MTRRPPLNQEQKDRIEYLREVKGLSIQAIADDIKMGAGAVSWHCLKEGIERKGSCRLKVKPKEMKPYTRNGYTVKPFTKEDDELLLKLEAQGLKYSEICKRMGRKNNSIKGRLYALARRDAREEECQ